MIQLRHCKFELAVYGCITRFSDGSETGNWPWPDAAYLRLVQDCGHIDPLEYCREHDLCHSFLAEKMFDRPSPILWASAHGKLVDGDYEEKLVYYFQRFVHLLAHSPDPEWGLWKTDFIALMQKLK